MLAKPKRPVTVFSVLALLVLIVGGGVTLVGSFLHLDYWMRSGTAFRVGSVERAKLPEGQCVVFFESPKVLPGDMKAVHLFVSGPEGEYIRPSNIAVDPEEEYAPRTILPTTAVMGRPMWQFDVAAAGWYTLRVSNDHVDQDPENDRFVIGKSPPSFRQLRDVNRQLKIAGLSFTGGLFVALYILHGITLSRRAHRPGRSGPQSAADDFPIDDF